MLYLSSHCSLLAHTSVSFSHHLLVNAKRISQYITSTGQKTGRSKMVNQVQMNDTTIILVAECQNLNSGSLLTNGLNSSSCFVGSDWPSSIPSSCVRLGSNFGCRNARKRLRRYMPRQYATMYQPLANTTRRKNSTNTPLVADQR